MATVEPRPQDPRIGQAGDAQSTEVRDPRTGAVTGSTAEQGPTEVEAAVVAARAAFVGWSALPFPVRAARLSHRC